MKLKEPEEEEIGFQMSPMIDIIFQLIIFFMVVSTFHRLEVVEGVKLPVASYSKEKAPLPGELVINLLEGGILILNQRKYTFEELEKVILNTVSKAPGVEFSAAIRADANVPHRDILKVVKICSKANIYKISFSTLPTEQ